jgi:hypothetical protein
MCLGGVIVEYHFSYKKKQIKGEEKMFKRI